MHAVLGQEATRPLRDKMAGDTPATSLIGVWGENVVGIPEAILYLYEPNAESKCYFGYQRWTWCRVRGLALWPGRPHTAHERGDVTCHIVKLSWLNGRHTQNEGMGCSVGSCLTHPTNRLRCLEQIDEDQFPSANNLWTVPVATAEAERSCSASVGWRAPYRYRRRMH